jgi:hypothetical protein
MAVARPVPVRLVPPIAWRATSGSWLSSKPNAPELRLGPEAHLKNGSGCRDSGCARCYSSSDVAGGIPLTMDLSPLGAAE